MLLGVIVTLADVVMQLYAEENCSGISTLISRAYAQCLTFSFLFNSLLMSSRMYRKNILEVENQVNVSVPVIYLFIVLIWFPLTKSSISELSLSLRTVSWLGASAKKLKVFFFVPFKKSLPKEYVMRLGQPTRVFLEVSILFRDLLQWKVGL